MARAARIGTPAWPHTLCAIALVANSFTSGCANGCELDSRDLQLREMAASGDGSVDPALGTAAGSAHPKPVPGGGGDAASALDARAPDGDAASSDSAVSSVPEAGIGTSPEAGTQVGTDSGSDTPIACHELVVSSEWIDAFSNCLEIQGEPWHLTSEGPSPFSSHLVSAPICMADPSPSAAGPAMLGFYLNQASADAEPADYDARLHGVSGFRFHVSEYLEGWPMPFVGVQSQGEIYCLPSSGFGDYEVRFSELTVRCWESSSGPSPDPEHIRALLFYYPPAWPGEPIGMCISELFALVPPG